MTNLQDEIRKYEQGAAQCREAQRTMQAAGHHDIASGYADAVDANLDRVNELKGNG